MSDELREQVAHLAAVSVENCQYLERAWADKSRLIADNARLQDEINRLSEKLQASDTQGVTE